MLKRVAIAIFMLDSYADRKRKNMAEYLDHESCALGHPRDFIRL